MLIDSEEVAKKLGVKPQTLATWRLYRKGLPFVKVGRLVRYQMEDVDAFIEKHLVKSEVAG